MFDKIAGMLGASPTQYRILLQTEKIVEKRARKGKRAFNFSLTLNCLFCFFISIPVTAHLFLRPNVFDYALIGITISMMIVALWTIPYFDILLSPINYPIVAHTPVSSRTYFFVKLTKVLTHTILLIVCSNLLPAIGGIWLRGEESSGLKFFFPFIYIIIVFIASFFTIGLMTTFAGYLTKLYSKKSLRHIAQYAQFIFPVLFPTLWILMHHILPTSLPEGLIIEKLNIVLKWFYILPNGWFAGTVSLFLGQIKWQFMILTVLAAASTLFLVMVPLRNIAMGYSIYLSYLMESVNRRKSELQVKTPLLARMFQTPAIRAVSCLTRAYLYRDKRILQGFLALFGSIIVFVVFLAQDQLFSIKWIKHSLFIGLSPGFSIMFFFICIGSVDSFILPIRYSDHWKASWMLKVTPLSSRHNLWRGVQATALLYIALPCTFVMLCFATVFWKSEGIYYILPEFVILLNYIVLYPKPSSRLPLSEELIIKPLKRGTFIPFLCIVLIIGIYIGAQYLTYRINVFSYFILYFLIVICGLINFIYFFTRKEVKVVSDV